MNRGSIALLALALALVPGAALATPFEDARDYVIADKAGDAIMIINVGAMGVNEQDERGYTLLHYAAKAGAQDAVAQLLGHGADPTIKAADGQTAMALAATPQIRAQLAAAMAKPR